MSEQLYWDSNEEIKIADAGGEMSLTLYRAGCGHFFTFSQGIENPPCPICNEFKRYYELLREAKTQIEADEQEIVRLTAERIQFSNDILSLLSEFGYATPEKGYDSPSLVLSDLRDCMSKLRNGAIAEYQLRVKAERGGRHGRIKSGD